MTPWTSTIRPQDVVSVVLGGGAGTRLFPLTKDRAKPAVPLGGKYRLVDIPISNCLNSDLRRIFVLTQFNSSSLHRHIQESYRFDNFSPGFVEILAAQQRTDREQWYQGTADAVRQNLLHLNDYPHRLVLILSGDQLYRMNIRGLHRAPRGQRGGGDRRDHAGAPRGGARLRNHADGYRRSGDPIRRKALGPRGAGVAAGGMEPGARAGRAGGSRRAAGVDGDLRLRRAPCWRRRWPAPRRTSAST